MTAGVAHPEPMMVMQFAAAIPPYRAYPEQAWL
jgi:hypothetical protein